MAPRSVSITIQDDLSATTVQLSCATFHTRAHLVDNVFLSLPTATSTIKVESRWLPVVFNRYETAISGGRWAGAKVGRW